jgi:hypothetical protein
MYDILRFRSYWVLMSRMRSPQYEDGQEHVPLHFQFASDAYTLHRYL